MPGGNEKVTSFVHFAIFQQEVIQKKTHEVVKQFVWNFDNLQEK